MAFESSQWTNFNEITTPVKNRGLSHADVVDYRRMKRFDIEIPELYRDIIHVLKEKGF